MHNLQSSKNKKTNVDLYPCTLKSGYPGSGVERRSSDSEPHTNLVWVRASSVPKYFLSGDA